MKYITKIPSSLLILGLVAVGVIAAAFLVAPDTLAGPIQEARRGAKSSGGGGPTFENVIETVTNILIFIVGAAAVIAIIIGGVQYTTSAGDESRAKTAKNTILYGIIGLVLAIASFGIVQFVLNQF